MSRIALAAVALLALLCILAGFVGAPARAAGTDAGSAELGQLYIEQGRYDKAVREFTRVVEADPTGVEGYRGRIEAQVLLGRYADAVRDYARVTAFVLPAHPDAVQTILAGYADRLAAAPQDVKALTGASFARWWFFDYAAALRLLDQLLTVRPNDPYGTLLRGSSRLLHGSMVDRGEADLERAIALAPLNPHIRFIVADAYTYGEPDPERAFYEASLSLDWGLDTPRIRAILAASYLAFDDLPDAAAEIELHIEMVTTQLVDAPPLAAGTSLALDLAPGRTYEIPVDAAAGETLSIATSSHDFYDSILALLDPDGTPVVGSDDYKGYFAGFVWTAGAAGTYTLRVTSFEAVSTGELVVTRR